MSVLIAPSILSANFLNLEKDIEMLNNSSADWIHIDIMDGVFVPNISFGFHVLEQVASIAKKPLDVHLMISEPDKYIERFAKAGANYISVHLEGVIHLNRTIQQIKEVDAKCGVAINPHTNIELLKNSIHHLDYVLLMSVNPGYGGQRFIDETINKIGDLKKLIYKLNPKCLIEIDGGVNETNAPILVKSGANVLVAGNAVFKAKNPMKAIDNLKNC